MMETRPEKKGEPIPAWSYPKKKKKGSGWGEKKSECLQKVYQYPKKG